MSKKISELPSATAPLSLADKIVVVQSAVTKAAPISDLPSVPVPTQTVNSSAGVLNLSAITVDTILTTLTENITSITLPTGTVGKRKNLTIRFVQDGVGGRTVSLTAFTWPGVPPVVASGANQITYIDATNCNNLGWDGRP